MTTFFQDVCIPQSGKMHIDFDVPSSVPVGEAVMTLTFAPRPPKSKLTFADICGMGKGKVWMSEDFDAPVSDFAEYI